MPRVIVKTYWAFIKPGDPLPADAVLQEHPLVIELARRDFAELLTLAHMTVVDLAVALGVRLEQFRTPDIGTPARRTRDPHKTVAWVLQSRDELRRRCEAYGPTDERTVLVLMQELSDAQ